METQESEGNPSMKGTRNCMQPFQWASSRTPRMKFDILAIGELALNSYTHTHIQPVEIIHTVYTYTYASGYNMFCTHTVNSSTKFSEEGVNGSTFELVQHMSVSKGNCILSPLHIRIVHVPHSVFYSC